MPRRAPHHRRIRTDCSCLPSVRGYAGHSLILTPQIYLPQYDGTETLSARHKRVTGDAGRILRIRVPPADQVPSGESGYVTSRPVHEEESPARICSCRGVLDSGGGRTDDRTARVRRTEGSDRPMIELHSD